MIAYSLFAITIHISLNSSQPYHLIQSDFRTIIKRPPYQWIVPCVADLGWRNHLAPAYLKGILPTYHTVCAGIMFSLPLTASIKVLGNKVVSS